MSDDIFEEMAEKCNLYAKALAKQYIKLDHYKLLERIEKLEKETKADFSYITETDKRLDALENRPIAVYPNEGGGFSHIPSFTTWEKGKKEVIRKCCNSNKCESKDIISYKQICGYDYNNNADPKCRFLVEETV